LVLGVPLFKDSGLHVKSRFQSYHHRVIKMGIGPKGETRNE
jgi:hypothetical protein